MKKPVLYVVLLTLLVAFATVPRTAQGFLADVTGHWAATLVTALEAKGVLAGDPEGHFAPDATLTRAQMAKLFAVGLGYEAEAQELQEHASRYVDLPFWHWGRGYVEVTSELGISEGFPGGEFGPNEPVTRAQLAVFVIRASGLTDRARLSRLEPTSYKDDTEIPSWARGAVFVARAEGLMMGTPEGNFLPNELITRAEGAVTVFRLLARGGSLFHMAGTLVRYDPDRGTGTVRDALGQESSFTMEGAASYMRQGALVSREQVRKLDQVFVVLGENGMGRFLEARFQDLLVDHVTLQGEGLSLTLPSGERQFRAIQPGALVLLNGRPASRVELEGTSPAYLVLDQVTGEVRLVDAVKAPFEGLFAGGPTQDGSVDFVVQNERRSYPLTPEAVLVREGRRVSVQDLLIGDRVRFALDAAGDLTYIEVMR